MTRLLPITKLYIHTSSEIKDIRRICHFCHLLTSIDTNAKKRNAHTWCDGSSSFSYLTALTATVQWSVYH